MPPVGVGAGQLLEIGPAVHCYYELCAQKRVVANVRDELRDDIGAQESEGVEE